MVITKMRIEIPEPKKCCFCLPLRRGLLAWVYIKFLFSIGVALFCAYFLMIGIVFHVTSIIAILAVCIVLLFVDVVFDVLFLVSAHKKNWKHLRVYYRYELVILCVHVVLLPCIVIAMVSSYASVHQQLNAVLVIGGSIFFQLLMQLYLVILVRSEILKLRCDTQLQFTNLVTDPTCTVIYPVV